MWKWTVRMREWTHGLHFPRSCQTFGEVKTEGKSLEQLLISPALAANRPQYVNPSQKYILMSYFAYSYVFALHKLHFYCVGPERGGRSVALLLLLVSKDQLPCRTPSSGQPHIGNQPRSVKRTPCNIDKISVKHITNKISSSFTGFFLASGFTWHLLTILS